MKKPRTKEIEIEKLIRKEEIKNSDKSHLKGASVLSDDEIFDLIEDGDKRNSDFIYAKEADKYFTKVTDEVIKELEAKSLEDGLTGLGNKRSLEKEFKTIESSCERDFIQLPVGLMYIDVNEFKLVNDNCGHDAGDFALQKIADVLKNSVREGVDLVFRQGGDEFAIIIKDKNGVGKKELMKITKNICSNMEKADFTHILKGEIKVKLDVSLSIGATLYSGGEVGKSFGIADKATYEAKAESHKTKGNQISFASVDKEGRVNFKKIETEDEEVKGLVEFIKKKKSAGTINLTPTGLNNISFDYSKDEFSDKKTGVSADDPSSNKFVLKTKYERRNN